jgi:hypothetical protein
VTLPEVTNSISDEMLVKWPNERNTRIYTETGKKHITCAVINIYQESGGDVMHIKESQEALQTQY